MNTEKRLCKVSGEEFEIHQNDVVLYEQLGLPLPVISPKVRFQERALWRNETSLYNRVCDVTGQKIISVYRPNHPFKVVTNEYYKSDEWNPFDFGKDYDYDKTFFEQFDELLKSVYKRSMNIIESLGENINSEYINFAGSAKNAYLCFNSVYLDNVMYSRGVTNARDSLDCYYCDQIERCYQCVNVLKSTNVQYGKNSSSCIDCILIEGCSGSSNCFGSVNVRNGSYQFFNEPLTKEEYEERVNEIMGSYKKIEEAKERFAEHRIQFPMRAHQNINTINTTGDYLESANDTRLSFEAARLENSSNVFSVRDTKDCIGIVGGLGAVQSIECVSHTSSSNSIASVFLRDCRDVQYSFSLNNCSDCLGCDSLKNTQYCILNKQYSKEEYETLRTHIIKELTEKGLYGRMIPTSLAPFSYNETLGQDTYLLTKEESLERGYGWEDNIQMTSGQGTLDEEEVPDHIDDVSDSILQEILTCQETGRNFRIVAQELQLYRAMNIPLPRKSFHARHIERIKKRGPFEFWKRISEDGVEVVTNYAPDRPERIFSEEGYRREVL
jgi:hypothetical protein